MAAGQRFLAVAERDAGDARALGNWGRALCLRAEMAADPQARCARCMEGGSSVHAGCIGAVTGAFAQPGGCRRACMKPCFLKRQCCAHSAAILSPPVRQPEWQE